MDAHGAPIGRPPARVSHGKTVHRTVLPPILRLLTLGISLPAGSDLGRCPKTLQGTLSLDPASLSRKAGSKAFSFLFLQFVMI